tara:strand:+ start:2169 stop:2783 length:615 start_codon:yes stop_codon:yes gene_type:complete
MKIGIINYGAGNIGSIKKSLGSFNVNYKIINEVIQLNEIDKLILPGQGAFENAIDNLKSNGLFDGILEFNNNKKPILAICLGMQLLFSKSSEFNNCDGLNILNGRVDKINIDKFPSPIIGWYNINKIDKSLDHGIFNFINNKMSFYFAHSMHCTYKGEGVCSYVKYNGQFVIATLSQKNIFATQFHPELSDAYGRKIIENFINL